MTQLYKGDHTRGEIELLEERVVFQNQFVTHFDDRVRFPGGSEGTYVRSVWNCSYGVCLIPITPSGEIVLVRNFRHALRDWTWEVMKGFGIEELSAQVCAAKELQEEAGLIADDMSPFQVIPHEGLALHIFIAKGLTETAMAREPGEAISEITPFDQASARDLMHSGACHDPLTLWVLAMFAGGMLPTD